MSRIIRWRSAFVLVLLGVVPFSVVHLAGGGEDGQRSREGLKEPVFRIAKRVETINPAQAVHPLDPAIEIAKEGLAHIHSNLTDYSCTLVKQERVNGVLNEPEYIYTEVRSRKVENGRTVVPFSIYMYFLKPESVKGREVIYVEGQNEGKLVAHEGNFLKTIGAVWLKPDGPIAMRGNRYPITEAGVENLIAKLIERGERDRQRGECKVDFLREAKINGRSCTVLQVTHPEARPYFDFHIATIFIDNELNLPVRYAAYLWPTKPGGKPEVLESYTYLNVKVNVGLTNEDFNHEKKFRL